MSKVLPTQAADSQIRKPPDPVCLLWGFTSGQMRFLSQMLGVCGLHFTTQLSPGASLIRTAIAPGSTDLSWFSPMLPVIRVSFTADPAPLPRGKCPLPEAIRKTPTVFRLPSQLRAFLTQVDQYCYPSRGRIINVFGLRAKSGVSTIAFGLANSAPDSIFVDASFPFPTADSSPYAQGLHKLGFNNIVNFSSRDLEDDLLVSRLRRGLPVVQNTHYLQLSSSNPGHVSRLFSLLTRAFSLVVVDWGQITSPRALNRMRGQALVVRDGTKSPENRQLLLQFHRQGIPVVNNRAPNKLFPGKNGNRELLLPHCRELRRLQAQGLGAYWPESLQAELARLLRSVLVGST